MIPATTKNIANPVFIVGMNGSGTSMLNESLGRHPQLYAFPGETRMIPHFIQQQHQFGDLGDDQNFNRFWQYINRSVPDFMIFNDHQKLDLPGNWREYPRNLAAILDGIFRQFAAASNKARWCEKSPNNSEHIASIAELFPGARFVHIVRDGRDCAASTNRRQHRNPELAIFRWRQIVSETRRQGRALDGRYLELRYEDLTSDSEYWMKQICQFLELDFDQRILESGMPQSAKKSTLQPGEVGTIEPNSKKFRSYFPPARIRRLEKISGKCLEELGYETDYCAGDKDIGRIRAKFTRMIDFLLGNPYLRRKLSGDNSVTWRRVYAQTLASIREYSAKKH